LTQIFIDFQIVESALLRRLFLKRKNAGDLRFVIEHWLEVLVELRSGIVKMMR
jgi:hypothetical protein